MLVLIISQVAAPANIIKDFMKGDIIKPPLSRWFNYTCYMSNSVLYFEEEYKKLINNFSDMEPPIDSADIGGLWQELLNINSEKSVFCDEKTEVATLSRMYIIEFYYFAAAVGRSEQYIEIQMLLQGLLTNISNTAFSVYKLAYDGLSYQAKILNRSLYELCMTLLNVLVDKEKRVALFESASKENEYETWRKYFSAKKLKTTMLAYEKKLGMAFSDDWHERTYKYLSSYVHNDFVNCFFGSMSNPSTEDEVLRINYAGNFADKADELFNEMNAILFYTGMHYLKMLVDPTLDIKKEHICFDDNENSNNSEFWNQASFLELWNRACYLKLLSCKG